jgi:hypothetical protein
MIKPINSPFSEGGNMTKEKLPNGVYRRENDNANLWISYYDENDMRIRESAKTSDPDIAQAFRDKRLRELPKEN